jgi:hypothetical protein
LCMKPTRAIAGNASFNSSIRLPAFNHQRHLVSRSTLRERGFDLAHPPNPARYRDNACRGPPRAVRRGVLRFRSAMLSKRVGWRLRRRQLTGDGDVEISGREFACEGGDAEAICGLSAFAI